MTLARPYILNGDLFPINTAWVLPRQKAIYLTIQKAASTSLHALCLSLGGLKYSFWKRKSESLPADYFKFSFVRNPYDRLVSCFADKILNSSVRGHGLPKMPRALFELGFRPKMSFERFLRLAVSLPDNIADRHVLSQHAFVTDKDGSLLLDDLGCFENLASDVARIFGCLGAQVALPHCNASPKRASWQSYYTPELAKLVRNRYRKDFELFGYSEVP